MDKADVKVGQPVKFTASKGPMVLWAPDKEGTVLRILSENLIDVVFPDGTAAYAWAAELEPINVAT